MNKIIFDYLKSSDVGLNEPIITAVMQLFDNHRNIEDEFAYWIQYGKTPDAPITIQFRGKEYSAETLLRDFKGITSYYDAYSMLVLLSDNPEYATMLLDRGLPIK